MTHPEAILGCVVCPSPGRVRTTRVQSVFARSIHLLADDGYITLGDTTLAAHPSTATWPDFRPDLQPGETVLITRQGLHRQGRLYHSFSGHTRFVPVWRVRTPARPVQRTAALESTLLSLGRLPGRGGVHTLLLKALGQPGVPESALESGIGSFFIRTIEQLGCFLRRQSWSALPGSAHALAGLGQGLTPSGDDFLAGVLSALRFFALSTGQSLLGPKMRSRIVNQAVSRTLPFSGYLLRCAARGLIAAPLANWLQAVLRGDCDQASVQTKACADIGHSSGLDTLCGMLLTLQALNGDPLWTEY